MENPDLRRLEYRIPPEASGISISEFLKKLGYSGRMLIHLKNTNIPEVNGICLNSQHALIKQQLKAGDILTVNILEAQEDESVHEAELPVSIIYEDEDIQLINKPSGLPIHPSKGHSCDSLGNALSYYAHHSLGKKAFTLRVINRLDMDTSGLLICAKNMLSGGLMGAALKRREIHREYLAICIGNPYEIKASLKGVSEARFPAPPMACRALLRQYINTPLHGIRISAPILDSVELSQKRCVDFEKGKNAVSFLQLLDYNAEKNLSLVRLKLETGRTHQIRVHMLYLNHPLLGDTLYNTASSLISRQALHSYSLSFSHPISGEKLYFTAAPPEDMTNLFPAYSFD